MLRRRSGFALRSTSLPSEVLTNAKAEAAMGLEYDKLQARVVWNVGHVRPWHEVATEAARQQKRGDKGAHVGSVFGVCVEKNAELKETGERRMYKGRYVFQGNCPR